MLINTYSVFSGFLALAAAEGFATELTKKKHRRSSIGRILIGMEKRALRRAAKRLGVETFDVFGYPIDLRPCPWWTNGHVGCCQACVDKYKVPVFEARKRNARRVRVPIRG